MVNGYDVRTSSFSSIASFSISSSFLRSSFDNYLNEEGGSSSSSKFSSVVS